MDTATATFVGDRTRRWLFGWWFTAIAIPAAWLLLGVGIAGSAVSSRDAIVSALLVVPACALYGFGFCVAWTFTLAKTVYSIESGDLVVRRGMKVLDRVHCSDIARVDVHGWMDVRHIITDPTPPPDWPAGLLTLRDGRTVMLPEIMVWGRNEASALGDELATAVRTVNTPNHGSRGADEG